MLRNPVNHPFGKSSTEVLHLLFFFAFAFAFHGGMQLTAVRQRKKERGKNPQPNTIKASNPLKLNEKLHRKAPD